MATEVTPKSGLLPLVSTGISHATLSNTAPSARSFRTYMTLSRVRFGGPTGMARVACDSLVALRPRLSPGLPFSRSLGKRAAPCRTAVFRLLHERKSRQLLDAFSSRWRPGGLSDQPRRSPPALRHRLSAALLS